jgi:hypothetical protein
MSTLSPDGLTSVNFWIEGSGANLPLRTVREWVFPAFNEVEGETAGVHYFVDASDYQSVQFKTLNQCRWVAGTSGGEGWLDITGTRMMQWTTENMLGNRNATTHAQTATRPVVQIPGLDVLSGLVPASSSRDFSHTLGIIRSTLTGSAPTTTPFEIGGVVYGGDTQKELYTTPGGAHGTYPGPTQNDLLQWNPAFTIVGDVTIGSPTIINITSTAGLKVGMRVRDVRTSASYVERFIKTVLTINSIETSADFSEIANLTFVCHGPTWISTVSITGIQHSNLTGLVDPADDHTQYVNLNGRTNGQWIGNYATTPPVHPTAGKYDFGISGGQLLLDPNDQDFTPVAGKGFDLRTKPTSAVAGAARFFYSVDSQTTGGLSAASDYTIQGTYNGSTALILRGIQFTSLSLGVGGTSTVTEFTCSFFSISAPTISGGSIGRMAGSRYSISASTTAHSMTNGLSGIEILLGPNALTGNMIGVNVSAVSSSTATGACAFYGYLIGNGSSIPFNDTGITDWRGLHVPNRPTNPTGTIRGLSIGDIMSHHVGEFRFGSTANPAHMADFAAGTTGLAPIRLAAGTNLTAAAAGCVEYDGTDLMFTHGDAVRTKVVTQRGAVNAVGQTAAVGATTVYAAPAAGYYVLHYTLEMTAFTAGTIQMQVNYTDDIGATNQTGAAVAALGRDRGAFEVYVNGAQNIQYQTNAVGFTGTYTVRARLEYLG